MHLIADNLNWFGDEPSNIESFSNVTKLDGKDIKEVM